MNKSLVVEDLEKDMLLINYINFFNLNLNNNLKLILILYINGYACERLSRRS